MWYYFPIPVLGYLMFKYMKELYHLTNEYHQYTRQQRNPDFMNSPEYKAKVKKYRITMLKVFFSFVGFGLYCGAVFIYVMVYRSPLRFVDTLR